MNFLAPTHPSTPHYLPMNAEWFVVCNDYFPTEKPESPTNFLVLRMAAIKNTDDINPLILPRCSIMSSAFLNRAYVKKDQQHK